MKLVNLLEDTTRTKLLHLQQYIIEQYLDGIIETELVMMPAHDGSWAPKVPVLEIKVNLSYWENVVRVVYGQKTSLGYVAVSRDGADGAFYLTLDPSNTLKLIKSGISADCKFEDVEHFPAWFEGSLVDDSNWDTNLLAAFIKHHAIKKAPLNFTQTESVRLTHYLLTTDVEVEHTSCEQLPTIAELDHDERSKTHWPAWKAWNTMLSPTRSRCSDAYVIWVKK